MKKILMLGAVLFSLSVWSTSGFASETRGGYITHIATVNGVLVFKVSNGTETGHATCNTTYRYAVSMNSPHYQVILQAFELGSKVTLGSTLGLGTCTQWSNSEDLRWIEVNKI